MSILVHANTSLIAPERPTGLPLFIHQFFLTVTSFVTSSILGIKDHADPDTYWISSKHHRFCRTSHIRKLKTLGTQRLLTQVHIQLQVILPNQIISTHQILFLNITWHQKEAHSGTRSFHHQFHLSYQTTSQVITLWFKSSLTSADSFYYSSEDSKAYQLHGIHSTIVYTWQLSHTTMIFRHMITCTTNSRFTFQINIHCHMCIPHDHYLPQSVPLYQTQFKSFAAFNFIHFGKTYLLMTTSLLVH